MEPYKAKKTNAGSDDQDDQSDIPAFVNSFLADPRAHLPSSRILEYEAGQLIYSLDQPATGLYLVIEGKVTVCRSADNGRPVVVDIYQADEFFGESALLRFPRAQEQAVALERTAASQGLTAGEMARRIIQDFFGKLKQHEYLLFLAYGFTDSFAMEFESALYTNATLEKSNRDTSNMPRRLREDGLGDTEINLRYRFLKENEYRPDAVAFFKTVFPIQKDKKIIGSQEWELSPGLVLLKGTPWGSFAGKVSMAYTSGEGKFEFGEYGIEYVKRLSPNWRVVLAFEGEQDEQEIVGEVQYALTKNVTIKLNSGFGLTKKAPDFAPEVGILFSF